MLRNISLFRGIGFRLAALTTTLVVISMMTLGAIVYLFVASSLDQRVRSRIAEETSAILAADDPGNPQAIVLAVEIRFGPDSVDVYRGRLTTIDGRHLAGNAALPPGVAGWSEQRARSPAGSSGSPHKLLMLTTPIDERLVLSIARDISWVGDVEKELISILGWSLLGGILLAGLTAFLANRQMSKRIDIISSTASAIMAGDLSQRVPGTGVDDNFDRLSSTLNAMLERIQALMASLNQVTNDIAHDLRTPLGRLRQSLELARTGTKSPEQYVASIDHAIIEADAMLSTFSALLRIAQIEGGTRRAAFAKVDLSKIAGAITEAYEWSAAEAGRTLSNQLSTGCFVAGDRDLLTQLFANLIENALAHTPKGTDIRVSVQSTDAGVVACVTDRGPGVPEHEREKILQRFYRLESSRTSPGTGLGLSLVAAIAELHQARLTLTDNHPGLAVCVIFKPGCEPV